MIRFEANLNLEASRIVFDRFRVRNQLKKAIEKVRGEEQQENKALKNSLSLRIIKVLDARVTNGMIEGLNS